MSKVSSKTIPTIHFRQRFISFIYTDYISQIIQKINGNINVFFGNNSEKLQKNFEKRTENIRKYHRKL